MVHCDPVLEDFEACYRACLGRDARFDGQFVAAVRTTGVYCRPSCPAIAKPQNVRFFLTAAAAQLAGFRACKRCRPDATPGSPEWDTRADVVARATRLIAEGVVDRDGVGGLARRLGYSVSQLERQLALELGAGPLALARAQRAQTGRILIETTGLPFLDVAFASGFASVRQLNDTIRAVYDLSPTQIRARARRPGDATLATSNVVELRLPFRQPFAESGVFAHLGSTAVPRVEELVNGTYRRTMRLPRAHAVVELEPCSSHVRCRLRLEDLRDLATAVARCRRLLDLDADPLAVDQILGADPVLAPTVRKTPGRRVPRTVDGPELAIRIVVGQQISRAAGRTHGARLVAALGTPLPAPDGGLTHLFPEPEAIAEADARVLAMPERRRATVRALAAALADGSLDLDPGADRAAAIQRLSSLPGIGPWTTATIAMRVLGAPDEFLPEDLGVRRAAALLGLPRSPGALAARAEEWRPWRSYAVQYLWGALRETDARETDGSARPAHP
jgi:AraC family transcriptional regulator, regulatory protein of adaptative response / DNA-3-methyladenine glycosylase II